MQTVFYKTLRQAALLLVLFLIVLPAAARKVGLEAMVDFEGLPVMEEGSSVHQVSSHDRSGANNDGFDGTYSSLYLDDSGDHVLFDEIGAGCIGRIWMTFGTSDLNPTNHIRFYFDEDTEPRIDISLEDFFDGTSDPFLSPLVGNRLVSSGGYYCYLPFPFARRCRVVMSAQPYFYNITYHRFSSTNHVETWTGQEDSSVVRSLWNQCGEDPKPTNGNDYVEGMLSIPAGETGSVFSVETAGAIAGLLIDPEPHTLDILTNVWVRMVWDEADDPQVFVPIGEFFGCGFGEAHVAALSIGMGPGEPYYCWFPMPFWESARIELVNRSAVKIDNLAYEVWYHDRAYDQARSGWFHATAQSKSTTASDDQDYILLNTNGWGKVVGLVLSVFNKSKDPLGYLEGDERVYIDGSATPQLYGTGLEDFFNGGWYFNQGPFSLPLHGNPMQKHEWRSDWGTPPYITNNFTTVYRFFSGEGLPFHSSIRLGVEHGTYSQSKAGDYSSVVYYYRMPSSRTGMVACAEFDVGKPLSELAVNYASSNSLPVVNSWRYEGDDDVVITDEGRICTGASSFSVPIGSRNMGLLIRRRTDAFPGRQRVNVFVDDALVGDWYSPDCTFSNQNKRWVDTEFRVSPEFTAGKTSVTIRLERDLAGADHWTEYYYWVYGFEPLLPTDDVDADGLPDTWETTYFNNILAALPGTDDDGDSMENLSEYVAGTNPRDSASLFHLQSDAGMIYFIAQSGRLYNVRHSTNLVAGGWNSTQTNVLGFGQTVPCPVDGASGSGFYRVDVRLP